MSAMRSLKARISGPNARPVAQLVTMGERASRRVQDSFHDFLAERVKLLEQLLAGLKQMPLSEAPSARRNFFTIVRDLRGSSALAQNRAANQFCASFETLLQARDPGDPRMFAAIQSHVDALGLIADGRAGDAQAQDMLASHLVRAVDALPVRMQDFRKGA
jgi:HPt (histidine-containing phosphotransfer) domain-containing protein